MNQKFKNEIKMYQRNLKMSLHLQFTQFETIEVEIYNS